MRYTLFIFCLVFTSFQLCSQNKKEIFLEDIFVKNTFKQDAVAGFRSMQDGRYYTEINGEGVLQKVNFETGKIESNILNLKDVKYNNKALKIDDYAFNNNETKLLLFTESENIYRRSVLHKVYVYDLNTQKIEQIKNEKILHPDFSPQSDKVAYVFQNNIYYYDLTSHETVPVTEDGTYVSADNAGNIINGNCDWVYEEEFEFTKAYEWSEKGDFIAYYHFDQTEVPEFNFTVYDKLYPTQYKYKYPKAGEKNSVVTIKIYHIEDEKTVICDIGDESDIYVPRIKINPFNNTLVIYKLNRLQNHLELNQVNARNGKTKMIYNETNKYFVEINDNITFLQNRNAFVYTSEKDGFNHIYIHDIDSASSLQLTKGNWEVTEINGVDEKSSTIYFMSTEVSPLDRQLYTISLDGNQKTCITPEPGWHDITYNSDFTFFLDKYSMINQPPTYTLVSKDKGKRVLKDNTDLKNKMSEYNLSDFELFKVPNNDGVLLNGWLLKPSNFSEENQYPLLMFQYSGPGSQQVMNQFSIGNMWWYQMLAQNGYIIVCVDGTGTGFRGEEFKKKTYLQLGKYESDDQIAVAKYFAQQPNIDSTRIGIWGWSYGGYMSSICLLKGADIFKTAIAVAPVTNWRYYDNIYTERYMRTPQENPKGYDDNSPVNMVNKLNGNYLLIHGSADDNVHLQNTMMMIDALVKSNKDFDSEIYPNKNHGIGGGMTRLQLYRKMTNFLLEKL
ncbi:MAG: S9 family peptidase [Bacteroidetes bacterium]|nr:S9 family peptidase [Bacteroidota bacterium]MBK7588711.1 S9 family peptidase [Bacteroidota bacterium]